VNGVLVPPLYPSETYNCSMADEHAAEAAELHKITVNLIPKAWDAANVTAERLGLSRTDVINRALQVYEWMERETTNGGEVFVRPRDGALQQVRFL
jgi:hypothetical protein